MTWFNRFGFTYLSYKALYSYQTIRLFLLFRILDPVMHFLFFATLAGALVGSGYLSYVVLGNIAYYTAHTMIINFMTMFRMERRFGTLELNIAAPLSTLLIIIRKSVVPLVDGILVFIIGLGIANFLFDVSFSLDSLAYLGITFVVMIFSLFSISLLLGGMALLFSNINLFLNLVLAFFQVFCGVNFSVTLFPTSLEHFARLLPLTHSIEALRFIQGGTFDSVSSLLWTEVRIGFVYLIFAIFLVKIMETVAKRNGALLKDV
ncbi:ABC transporter permease [Fredinandcohnia sp. 179-A 10B2 NHS]|uniref:ABC transporter permease n=1 Tax=Fredinandcohnia sp. 179-A 10B2 NHS TaxID=3235176 RepID=UPI0039A34E0E